MHTKIDWPSSLNWTHLTKMALCINAYYIIIGFVNKFLNRLPIEIFVLGTVAYLSHPLKNRFLNEANGNGLSQVFLNSM